MFEKYMPLLKHCTSSWYTEIMKVHYSNITSIAGQWVNNELTLAFLKGCDCCIGLIYARFPQKPTKLRPRDLISPWGSF